MCEAICNLKEMVTADSRQLWEKLYYTTGILVQNEDVKSQGYCKLALGCACNPTNSTQILLALKQSVFLHLKDLLSFLFTLLLVEKKKFKLQIMFLIGFVKGDYHIQIFN